MECQMTHNPIISEIQNHLFQGPKSIYGAPSFVYEIYSSSQAAP